MLCFAKCIYTVCGGVTIFTLSVRPWVRPWHFFPLIYWKRSDGYLSVSADTLISIRCTFIRQSKGYGPILSKLLPFVKFLNAIKSLCAQHLFNQWLEFDQTSIDASLGRAKEVIRFWFPPCITMYGRIRRITTRSHIVPRCAYLYWVDAWEVSISPNGCSIANDTPNHTVKKLLKGPQRKSINFWRLQVPGLYLRLWIRGSPFSYNPNVPLKVFLNTVSSHRACGKASIARKSEVHPKLFNGKQRLKM